MPRVWCTSSAIRPRVSRSGTPRVCVTRRHAPPVRSGMTLLELMAALVLTGIMATVGTAAFSSIIDHRQVLQNATVEVERAAATREMLQSWVSAGTIQFQQGGGPNVRQRATSSRNATQPTGGVTAAVTDGDELTFTTSAHTPAQTADTRVRLFIDTDESTPETGLTMEYQANTFSPLARLQLDSTITIMTVEILDSRTNRWVPSKEAATVRPLAVRLTFVAEEGKYLSPLLQVPFVFRVGDPSTPVGAR